MRIQCERDERERRAEWTLTRIEEADELQIGELGRTDAQTLALGDEASQTDEMFTDDGALLGARLRRFDANVGEQTRQRERL